MRWSQLPLWLKAWIIVGVLSWAIVAAPYGMTLPYALIPASVFGSSMLVPEIIQN